MCCSLHYHAGILNISRFHLYLSVNLHFRSHERWKMTRFQKIGYVYLRAMICGLWNSHLLFYVWEMWRYQTIQLEKLNADFGKTLIISDCFITELVRDSTIQMLLLIPGYYNLLIHSSGRFLIQCICKVQALRSLLWEEPERKTDEWRRLWKKRPVCSVKPVVSDWLV